MVAALPRQDHPPAWATANNRRRAAAEILWSDDLPHYSSRALSKLDLRVGCHWLCQCPTYEYRPFLNTGGASGTRVLSFDKALVSESAATSIARYCSPMQGFSRVPIDRRRP